jgi:hypothetical protein
MRSGQSIVAFSVAVLTLLVQSVAQPQQALSRNDTTHNGRTIVLCCGAAVPVGEFAASSEEHNSFALPGVTLGTQFAASVTWDWKITGGVVCSYHRYDESAKAKVMRDSLPKYTIHANGYVIAEILAGVRYDVLRTSRLTLFGIVQTGVLINKYPEIREDNITPSGSGRRTISTALAISPALNVGCGVETKKRWWVGVSYIIGTSSFTRSVYEAHGTTPTAYFTKRISQTVATIRLLVGYSIDV